MPEGRTRNRRNTEGPEREIGSGTRGSGGGGEKAHGTEASCIQGFDFGRKLAGCKLGNVTKTHCCYIIIN